MVFLLGNASLLPAILSHQPVQFLGTIIEDALQEAVCRRTTCSLIHLDTLMKVDIVVAKHDAFEIAVHRRVAPYLLDERYPSLQLASAVEMILVKLHRYPQDLLSRTDGMRDDVQWNESVGMLKIQGSTLERDFLENWARTLNIIEVLRQALIDAGVEQKEAA